jgi:hypothetical protein
MPNQSRRRRALLLPFLAVSLVAVGCASAPPASPSAAPPSSAPASPSPSPATPAPATAAPTPTSRPATPTTPPTPSPTPTTGLGHPTGPNELVIRVSSGGGLAGPAPAAQSIPSFSLYGDGRVILQGAQIELFPPPALPPVIQMKLTPEAVDLLLAAARSAGLTGPDRTFDLPTIMDATTTVFVVVTDAGRHTTSAYALHEASGFQDQMPNDERAARAALIRFEGQLGDLPNILGSQNVGQQQPYTPTGMRIFPRVAQGPIDPGLPPQIRAWPLADLATFGEPWPGPEAVTRCGVVEGTDLDTLLPLLRESTSITRWVSKGVAYELALRPLLPDESGCPSPF